MPRLGGERDQVPQRGQSRQGLAFELPLVPSPALQTQGAETREVDVLFYVPGLPAEYHAALWGRTFPTAAAAVEALAASLQPGARVAVIPEGPYVLARAAAA